MAVHHDSISDKMFLGPRTFPTKEDGSIDIPPPPTNMTFAPGEVPPWPWPIPENPSRSLQPDIIVCAVITLVIALSFVGMRFWCRGRILHVLGAEDWLILAAVIFSMGLTGSAIEQAARGAGQHTWLQDWFQGLPMQRAAWYGILFYWMSLECTKLSILLLYRRFFTMPWARWLNYLVLAITVGVGIYLGVTVFTACTPLEAFWNWGLFLVPGTTCRDGRTWWTNAGLHIFTDVVIIILPLPVLSHLRLPRRQKFALFGVFTLGAFVVAISIYRLVYLITMESNPPPDWDNSYNQAFLTFWTTVEVNASICCACVVTLKPLAMRVFPKLLARSRGSDDGRRHHANGPSSPDLPGSNGRGRVPTVGSRPIRLRTGEYLDHSMVDPDEETTWINGLDAEAREKMRREREENGDCGEDALTSPTLVEEEKDEGLKRVDTHTDTVEHVEGDRAGSATPRVSRDLSPHAIGYAR